MRTAKWTTTTLPFDLEIEQTFRWKRLLQRQRMAKQQQEHILAQAHAQWNMNAANRLVGFHSMPNLEGISSSIATPPINFNCFKLKPSINSIIQNSCQFRELPSEDLNAHISKFLALCDTIHFDVIFEDAIRLKLFGFSLRDKV